jgi:MFS-type transporter involved in bile tolerance (Atg22 family)
MGYDVSRWGNVVFSLLNVALIGVIDKQLPSRRWKNLGILLGIMGTMFVFFGTRKYFSGTLSMDVEVWIFGILILVAFGYSIYSLWRWMRNIMWYKDLILQRELRTRRRRKIGY